MVTSGRQEGGDSKSAIHKAMSSTESPGRLGMIIVRCSVEMVALDGTEVVAEISNPFSFPPRISCEVTVNCRVLDGGMNDLVQKKKRTEAQSQRLRAYGIG